MIRKIQIIFVFKTSRLWKIFTAFAYADIIGSTYIACRNKYLTKNKNISRTSRNVLLLLLLILLLCAKTTIVICSKEQLLAMIFVTDNLVYVIYISSKFIANFHDVSVSQVFISQFRTIGKFLFSFLVALIPWRSFFVATSFGRSLR